MASVNWDPNLHRIFRYTCKDSCEGFMPSHETQHCTINDSATSQELRFIGLFIGVFKEKFNFLIKKDLIS